MQIRDGSLGTEQDKETKLQGPLPLVFCCVPRGSFSPSHFLDPTWATRDLPLPMQLQGIGLLPNAAPSSTDVFGVPQPKGKTRVPAPDAEPGFVQSSGACVTSTFLPLQTSCKPSKSPWIWIGKVAVILGISRTWWYMGPTLPRLPLHPGTWRPLRRT